MDFYSSSLSPVFHSKIRKCYNCKKLSENMMLCSRCKVFAFCSKDCQVSAWKRVHKSSCKPMNPNTPREIDTYKKALEPDELFHFITKITKIHDDISLDQLYKYILIKPRNGNNNMVNDIVGIEDDKDLDIYMAPTDEIEGESEEHGNKVRQALGNIYERYNFPTTLGRSNIPGFSSRLGYNDYNIVAHFDDCCKNSDANPNPTADTLLMTKGLRGNVILVAFNGSAVYGSLVVPMTLRDIFWYAQHTYECGAKNCVPERAHFENIERMEVAQWMSSKNFQTISI